MEDNEYARATAAELLRAYGYEVVEVADGAGALPVVRAHRPAAVLLDIGLPDMDGYAVARALREDPQTRGIPLVALTGYGQRRDKDAAAGVGLQAHLVKPVTPEDLVVAVEAVLAREAAAPA